MSTVTVVQAAAMGAARSTSVTVPAANAAGVFTAGSAVPPNLTALNTAPPIAPSPTTAWTTGRHVVLGNGSKAYWNGTTWVAGTAP